MSKIFKPATATDDSFISALAFSKLFKLFDFGLELKMGSLPEDLHPKQVQ